MTKIAAALAGLVLAAAGVASVQLLAAGEPAGASPLTLGTTAGTTTAETAGIVTTGATATVDTAADVSGPCDEAEHADDPRCAPGAVDDDRSGTRGGDDDDRAEADDSSGRSGGDDDHDDHDEDDDRSGSNSGRS